MPDELPDLRTLRVKRIKLELIAIGIKHRVKERNGNAQKMGVQESGR